MLAYESLDSSLCLKRGEKYVFTDLFYALKNSIITNFSKVQEGKFTHSCTVKEKKLCFILTSCPNDTFVRKEKNKDKDCSLGRLKLLRFIKCGHYLLKVAFNTCKHEVSATSHP